MTKFCVHEKHGGVCKKTGTFCNLGACPYEDLKEFTVVRHGKRYTAEKYNGYLCWNCDQCHQHFTSQKSNYYPNCGAKMDGDEQ